MKKTLKFASGQPNPDFPGVSDIQPDELSQHLNQVHLIDVREPSEFTGELGHIPGAKLLVLSTLPDKIETLPKDETIVFICRSGGRSARAAAFAKENGFNDVHNMKGGMLFWNALQLPVETT